MRQTFLQRNMLQTLLLVIDRVAVAPVLPSQAAGC